MYWTLVDLLVDLYIDSTLTCGLLKTSGTGEVLGERRPPPSKNLERQIRVVVLYWMLFNLKIIAHYNQYQSVVLQGYVTA